MARRPFLLVKCKQTYREHYKRCCCLPTPSGAIAMSLLNERHTQTHRQNTYAVYIGTETEHNLQGCTRYANKYGVTWLRHPIVSSSFCLVYNGSHANCVRRNAKQDIEIHGAQTNTKSFCVRVAIPFTLYRRGLIECFKQRGDGPGGKGLGARIEVYMHNESKTWL